jgi:hypothetical protein
MEALRKVSPSEIPYIPPAEPDPDRYCAEVV